MAQNKNTLVIKNPVNTMKTKKTAKANKNIASYVLGYNKLCEIVQVYKKAKTVNTVETLFRRVLLNSSSGCVWVRSVIQSSSHAFGDLASAARLTPA